MHASKLSLLLATILTLCGCQRPTARPATLLTPATVRAERRAYDGAPPVIPHAPLGPSCTTCHAATAREVPGIGFAPPNPHLKTPGIGDQARCQQCHVFQATKQQLVTNDFRPWPQQLRKGERLYPHAPPVTPHRHFMREDCTACHAGMAARPEILCTHPERVNCLQCHARRAGTVPSHGQK